jgi:hypothetical protein
MATVRRRASLASNTNGFRVAVHPGVTGEVGFDALVYSQTRMTADAWHRMATARRATPLRPDQDEYGGTEYGGLPVK